MTGVAGEALQQGAGAEGGKAAQAAQAAMDPGFRQPIGASKPNAELLAASKQLQSSMNTGDTNTILGGTSLQGSMRGAGDALQSQAVGTGEALQQQAKEVGDIHQQELEHQARTTASMQGVEAEIKARMNAIKDVDPDRYWNSKSTGNKLMTGIGMALGQLGAAMPHTGGGGKNPAMELFQSGLDNDIKSQQKNIDNEWKKVSTVHDLGQDALKEAAFKSDRLDKAKIEAGEKAKLMIGQHAALTQSAQAQAELAKLSIGIQQQYIDGPKVAMDQRRVGFLQAQAAQAAAAAGAGQPGPDAMKAYRAYSAKMDEENAKNRADNKTETPVLGANQWYKSAWLGQRSVVDPNAPPPANNGVLSKVNAADRPLAEQEFKDRTAGEQADHILDSVGKGPSTNHWSTNPLNWALSGGPLHGLGAIPGTEAAQNQHFAERQSVAAMSEIKKQLGVKFTPGSEELYRPLMPDPNGNPEEEARKAHALRALVGGDRASPILDANGLGRHKK